MPSTMRFESRRLLIREFSVEDCAVIYRLSREQSMRRFLPDQVYDSESEAAKVLDFLIAQYGTADAVSHGTLVLAVTVKPNLALIGHVGLSPVASGQEIGYAIAEEHQKKGYATELVRATLDWAFEHHNLPFISAIVASHNHASIRVLENAGFLLQDERQRSLHGRMTLVRNYQASAPSC